MKLIFALAFVALLIAAQGATCPTTDSCAVCLESLGCGFCTHTQGVLCGAYEVGSDAVNISTNCNTHQGVLVEHCTNTAPPVATGPNCATDNCGVCLETAGCGYCSNHHCGRVDAPNPAETIGSICEAAAGTIVTSCAVPTPVAVNNDVICASATACGACREDIRCAYCVGSTDAGHELKFCHPKTDANTAGHCYNNVPGSNDAACPLPPVVHEPIPVVPPAETTTDNVCQGKGCDGCLSTSGCGLCKFSNGQKTCRHRELTVNGKTGSVFCAGENGDYILAAGADAVAAVCAADTAQTGVNSGTVTPQEVTNDIAQDESLAGLIVVVTVITQAANDADGAAHFQTFVDVIGDAAPTPGQMELICHAIKVSLATHLTVDVGLVQCHLDGVNKRMTSSYVASLTVGGRSNMQGGAAGVVVASIGLVALGVAAVFSL